MRVAVLGAGIQGVCVAFELARHGVAVDLYDRHLLCVAGDSVRNEGKVHLGYVYAADESRRTARMMVEGALSFGPLLRRWLGAGLDDVPVSEPFDYLVHRDSLVGVDEVEEHFAACHGLAIEQLAGSAPDYFGQDPRVAPQRLSRAEAERWYDPRTLRAAYRTSEVAVDPAALGMALRARVDTDGLINPRLSTEVLAVTPDDDGAVVHATRQGVTTADRYDHVVNALWSGRLAIDRTAGVQPGRPWLHRMRYIVRIPRRVDGVRATTIVLGPFGDVAGYGDRGLFLSWYPEGRRHVSSELAPPAWPTTLDEAGSATLRTAIAAGLGNSIRAVAELSADVLATGEVQGGIVFAHGEGDIHEPDSHLHERYRIGPRSFGRYHSIDTGKMTTAPLFAHRMAETILGAR